MDDIDEDENVDIPTFTEQDMDNYQDELGRQVEMVHNQLRHLTVDKPCVCGHIRFSTSSRRAARVGYARHTLHRRVPRTDQRKRTNIHISTYVIFQFNSKSDPMRRQQQQ
ncbi:hypothetical protein LSAT2_008342 [Lamellibrachia satsuma]|nr:hypothetical protein LSAT2_008342 [Lamellibrachia satsuma]